MDRRKLIALCVPGEMFSQKWMIAWTNIITQLPALGFDMMPIWCYTSCPAATRASIVQGVRELWSEVEVDYAFWLDDDQIMTPAQILQLTRGVDANPDALVAGWTWIHQEDGPVVSNGRLSPLNICLPSLHREMKGEALVPRDYTGFACVMHKPELFNVAKFPFAPIPNEHSRSGASGEDVSFCIRLKQAGKRVLIDPACLVPHLKLQPVADPVNEVEPINLMEVA